ncbi:hypothetical protein AB0M58_13435 [Streptomyces bobili]|uniref:hypothetical protein n=1 Tax=Streptomyces bobili TaxID=67280 RepID=UPI00342E8E87
MSTVEERPVPAVEPSTMSLDQSKPEGLAIAKASRAAAGEALPGDPSAGNPADALGNQFGIDPNGPGSQVDQAVTRTWVQNLPDAELLAVLADATTEFTARAEQALAEQVHAALAAYYEPGIVRVTFTVTRGQRTFSAVGAVLHRVDNSNFNDHFPCVDDDLDHFSLLHKPISGATLEVVLAPEGHSVTYHPPGSATLRLL